MTAQGAAPSIAAMPSLPPNASPAAPAATDQDLAWYVVRCKPREDLRALENLRNQGFEAFAPMCLIKRRRGTVRRQVSEPLFPGYVFARLSSSQHNWSVLRSTRGVAHLVRFGQEAPRVPQAVMNELQLLDHIDLDTQRAQKASALKPGDAVAIEDGPLAGLQGVFEQADGEGRASVLVQCMQRWVRVSLSGEQFGVAAP